MTTKPTVPDLKELFKQAAEIANQVPESMREAAFNRAVDLLTQGIPRIETGQKRVEPKSAKSKNSSATKTQASGTSSIEILVAAIDSTQHPGITSSTTALDRSLMLLQIARSDHDIDGLTPPEIAKVLTDKFRVRTTSEAVSMALGSATKYVNRIPEGQAFRYQIMSSGEEYLAHLDGGTIERKSARGKTKTAKPSTRIVATPTEKTQSPKSLPKTTKRSKTSGKSVGPKAAIQSLIDSSFFAQGKTAPEVQEFLNKKRGYNFGTAQLRLAMLRLVRDNKLEREENNDGHYEYSVSKS